MFLETGRPPALDGLAHGGTGLFPEVPRPLPWRASRAVVSRSQQPPYRCHGYCDADDGLARAASALFHVHFSPNFRHATVEISTCLPRPAHELMAAPRLCATSAHFFLKVPQQFLATVCALCVRTRALARAFNANLPPVFSKRCLSWNVGMCGLWRPFPLWPPPPPHPPAWIAK